MTGLFTGIYNKFTELTGGNHNSLYTGVSGKMYLSSAPQGTTYPYIIYSLVNNMSDYSFVETFEDSIIQFDIISQNSSSTECNTLYGYLTTLYDKCTLTVTGYNHLRMDRLNSNLDFFYEDGVWRYLAQYRSYIHKT